MQEAVACHLRCVSRKAPRSPFLKWRMKMASSAHSLFYCGYCCSLSSGELTFTRGNKSHNEKDFTSWGSQMCHTWCPPLYRMLHHLAMFLADGSSLSCSLSNPGRRQGPPEWWLDAQILEPACLGPNPSSPIY